MTTKPAAAPLPLLATLAESRRDYVRALASNLAPQSLSVLAAELAADRGLAPNTAYLYDLAIRRWGRAVAASERTLLWPGRDTERAYALHANSRAVSTQHNDRSAIRSLYRMLRALDLTEHVPFPDGPSA